MPLLEEKHLPPIEALGRLTPLSRNKNILNQTCMDTIDQDLVVERMYHPENFEDARELEEENERDFEAIGGMDRF